MLFVTVTVTVMSAKYSGICCCYSAQESEELFEYEMKQHDAGETHHGWDRCPLKIWIDNPIRHCMPLPPLMTTKVLSIWNDFQKKEYVYMVGPIFTAATAGPSTPANSN